MIETCQGFVGATRDGEGVIWNKTRRDGGHRLEGTWGKSNGYYLALPKRWHDVSCHGRKISDGTLVEIGKSIYVKVINEQALSKAVVVQLEDARGLESKLTHQHVQSSNQWFEEGWCEVRRWRQGVNAIKFTLNFYYVWEFGYNSDMGENVLGVKGCYMSYVGFSSNEEKYW
jgi:hypothetical protein